MYMSNQATQNQNVYFQNNLPSVHPIDPQNISNNVSFSRPDSYENYADWLNDSQGQENWTIEEIFLVFITTKLFLLLYTYTYGQVWIEGDKRNRHYFYSLKAWSHNQIYPTIHW